MTEEKSKEKKVAENIIGRLLVAGIIVFVLYGNFSPVTKFVDETLEMFGVDMGEKRIAKETAEVGRIEAATESETWKINLTTVVDEWANFTDVQRENFTKQNEGKIVEFQHYLFDIEKDFDRDSMGYSKYKAVFNKIDFYNPKYPVVCSISSLEEATDKRLESMVSGKLYTFRAEIVKLGSLNLKLTNCVFVR